MRAVWNKNCGICQLRRSGRKERSITYCLSGPASLNDRQGSVGILFFSAALAAERPDLYRIREHRNRNSSPLFALAGCDSNDQMKIIV
jgi:hypothetical protein